MFWLVAIWILNALISTWNAYAVGKAWAEAKAAGGWPRLLAWSGAVMAATGFSWCILIFLSLGTAHFLPMWKPEMAPHMLTMAKFSISLGYLLLVPGLLLSGIIITLESWRIAYREGGVLNYGVAGYNTLAQVHNTYSVIESFGPALKEAMGGLGKLFDSDDEDSNPLVKIAIVIGIVIVVVSLAGGILLTVAIIKRSAGTERLASLQELQERRKLKAA